VHSSDALCVVRLGVPNLDHSGDAVTPGCSVYALEFQLGRLCPLRRQRARLVVRQGHKYPLLPAVDRR
jgi:hypothetical protein